MPKLKDQNSQTTYSTYFKAAFPHMKPATTINANGQIEVRIAPEHHAEFVSSMKNPKAKLIQKVPHFVAEKESASAAATSETMVFGGFKPNFISPSALNPSQNLINQVLKLADARYLNQLGFRLGDWDIKDIDPAHGTYTVKVDHIDSKTQATFEENIASANERFLANFKVSEAILQERGSDYEMSYQPTRNAVIKVSSSDKSTVLQINYEQITLAMEKCDGIDAPSIAYNKTTDVFLLHPKCVAAQAVAVFGGFIGAPKGDGDYTPLLFNAADSARSTKSHFTFLADCSGSMFHIMDSVRTQIKSAIKYALKQGNEVDINVVGFNDNDDMKMVFTKQSLEADIDVFINRLKADGGTNLRGALYNAIKSHENDATLDYSASTIFLLSDGEHSTLEVAPQMSDVQRLIGTNKQAVVAISIGERQFPSLDTITKQLGCPHLHAKTPSDIEHIKSYISSSSARFQIGDNIITTVLEMAKTLPSVTMKLGDQIIKDGKTGTLDIEAVTTPKADAVIAIYKAVHEKCLAIAKFAGSKFYTTSAAVAGRVVQEISTLTDQALEQIGLKSLPLTELEGEALKDHETHHATTSSQEMMSMGFTTCQEVTQFGEQILLGHHDIPQLT